MGSCLSIVWAVGCGTSDDRVEVVPGSNPGTVGAAGGQSAQSPNVVAGKAGVPEVGLGGATTTRSSARLPAGSAASATASEKGGAGSGGAANSTLSHASGGGIATPSGGANGSNSVTAKGGAFGSGGANTSTTKTSGGSTSGGSINPGVTPVTLWLAGDSTVQNCTTKCPCGWGSQFAAYFNSAVTVKNNAAGGRSIQTWMYEPNVTTTMGSSGECQLTETNSTRWAATLSGIKAGDYLFIQFGINDGSATCDRHVGTARYQALMTRMAQAALDKGAYPILLTAVSMISCRNGQAVASRGFLTETKAAATKLGIPVIDLHQLSVDLYNSLGFCPLPAGATDISASTGGAVGAFFCEDHTHFDTSGAKEIAKVVAEALRTQNIPLAAYLK